MRKKDRREEAESTNFVLKYCADIFSTQYAHLTLRHAKNHSDYELKKVFPFHQNFIWKAKDNNIH